MSSLDDFNRKTVNILQHAKPAPFGLPVAVDERVPADEIRFQYGDQVVGRIVNVGVPPVDEEDD